MTPPASAPGPAAESAAPVRSRPWGKWLFALAVLAILTALAWPWTVQPLRNRAHFTQCLRETLAESHTLRINANLAAQRITPVSADSPLWQPLHEALPRLQTWNVFSEDGYLGCMVDYVYFEVESQRRTVTFGICADNIADLWIVEGPVTWHYRGSLDPEEIARLRRILPKEMTTQPGQFDPPEEEM